MTDRTDDLDDETIDRLLAGHPVSGQAWLSSFVEDVALAASGDGVAPSAQLVTLFAEGRAIDTVTSPARRPTAGPAPWRKRDVLEIALGKLASVGLAAKLGLALSVVTLGGTAAAATGSLPDVAQDRVAAVAEQLGIDIPGGASAGHRQDGEHRPDGEQGNSAGHRQDGNHRPDGQYGADDEQGDSAQHRQDGEHRPDGAQGNSAGHRQDGNHRPEQVASQDESSSAPGNFGAWVSDQATDGVPQEDGRQFGEDVSSAAQEDNGQADTAGDDNPGTSHRDEAGSQQPEDSPTADDNPGTSRRP